MFRRAGHVKSLRSGVKYESKPRGEPVPILRLATSSKSRSVPVVILIRSSTINSPNASDGRSAHLHSAALSSKEMATGLPVPSPNTALFPLANETSKLPSLMIPSMIDFNTVSIILNRPSRCGYRTRAPSFKTPTHIRRSRGRPKKQGQSVSG